MMLNPDKLFGHYKLQSAIGSGGMGEVFLAEDTRLDRRVAIKFLAEEFSRDAERLRRFVQEAKAASALNHPNIITIHEIGETDEKHFIATEYIDGETLRVRLENGRLPLSEVLSVAVQTAEALAAAHAAGIVHRDIKPENIMLRGDGYVKVLDFGLAKLTERRTPALDSEAQTRALQKTADGVVLGTLAYMSPEQSRGKQIDERTDIWSLGVVIYEMLAGHTPFAGETMSDIIAAIIKSEPPSIQSGNEEIPQELQRIVRKTLQKNADERYQTARDLLIDLKTLRRDLDLQDALERTIPPARKNAATQTLADSSPHAPTQTINTISSAENSLHTTSSAEYVVSEIKQHKRGFAIGLATLLLAAAGVGIWFSSNRPTNLTNVESIAVMPFVNEGGNADTEYLSDGMTESLISSLSQLPKLSVKARSSVFRYKGKDTSAQTVGNELSVQAVLLGRVIQRGDQLTLRLELVDAKTENVIWSEQYNRKQADLVSLQMEIAHDVSNKLKTKLSGADEQKLSKNSTGNPEAYQLYLKGRYHWNKRTATDVRKSVDYFQQAIDKDPGYALAYAGLAQAYILIPNYTRASPKEPYEKARAAAMKALEMDETLADGHSALASIKADYDWNFPEAEKEFKRAIELNPNDATARQWYSEHLLVIGRNDEAIAEMKRAQELDPLSLIISAELGFTYKENRQYDQAIEQLRKTIEMDRNFPRAHLYLALAYEEKGMFEEAISEHEKHFVLQGISPEEAAKESSELKEIYKKSGAKGYWRKQIEIGEKRRASHSDSSPPLSIAASFYAQLEENDQAFALLERAYEQREAEIIYLKSPIYDPIRSDPRFQDLLRRIGLPQ